MHLGQQVQTSHFGHLQHFNGCISAGRTPRLQKRHRKEQAEYDAKKSGKAAPAPQVRLGWTCQRMLGQSSLPHRACVSAGGEQHALETRARFYQCAAAASSREQ